VLIGLTIERATLISPGHPRFVLAIVFLLNNCFSLWYLSSAIAFEAPLEMSNFVLSKLGNAAYIIANYVLSEGYEKSLTNHLGVANLARLIVVIALSAILVPWGSYLTLKYIKNNSLSHHRSCWNDAVIEGGKKIHFFHAMFKLNIQVDLTMVMLAVESGFAHLTTFDILALTLGPFYLAISRVVAHFVLRNESTKLLIVYLVLSAGEIGFIGSEFHAVTYPDIDKAMRGAVIGAGSLGVLLQIVLAVMLLDYRKRFFGKGVNLNAFDVSVVPVTATNETSRSYQTFVY
jgi:hypothetical protein